MKDLNKRIALMEASLRSAESYLCEDLDAICDDVMREYAEDTLEDVRKGLKAAEEVNRPKVWVLYIEKACDGSFSADFALFSKHEKAMEEFEKYVHKIGLFAKDYKWVVERNEMCIEAHDDDYVDRFKAEVKALEVD